MPAQGNVYIAGSTDGSIGGPNQGRADAYLAKSPAGLLLWTRQLGTSEVDAATGVAIDRDGNAYVSRNTRNCRGRCLGETHA